ncbi:TetR/AcrR family transcriptional regulator [Mycolicibacter senuensis]|jgi:AcrR family transcriptional regulator|uniref:TetR/AcrR family transcriptional regulator n=1 Tax=Mycolicibacter senuensis TaxID=386913 RepID=UPI000DCB6819|nr:TetR/AcrR family transcriptional regulator [Mycolicibacter senuensis]RAU97800.1 TetR family transcriptional regulator [Mycolicibacter senuensis]
MPRAPQTARSERTREALRQAALVRFLAQGVEDTSAEQIAADAGVSLRTFYRHFTSKHDLLFADYDAGLQWFRSALADRPPGEPIIESVQAAIFAFPYDVEAVTRIAALRADELDPERIVRHIRQVEADFADAVAERLRATGGSARPDGGGAKRGPPHETAGDPLRVAVTARCIAAAVFAAMEVWMLGEDRSLAELARMCRTALDSLANR